MSKTNPKVDGFLRKVKKWRDELSTLRRIFLECGLDEEIRWRQPCYRFEDSNVLIIGAFKEHCVLNFFKGSLLKDTHGLLNKPGENSQSSRVIRFTSVQGILKVEPILKALIAQAMDVERAGLKVELKKITERPIPEELQTRLDENPALKAAFHALTPGRQRAYLLHFSSAKQSKTRAARIDTCTKRILKGKGLDD